MMVSLRRESWRRSVTVTALSTALSLVTALLVAPPALAKSPHINPPPAADPGPAVRGVSAVKPHFNRPVEHAKPFVATKTRWPSATSATISLHPPAGPIPPNLRVRRDTKVRVPGTPVWVRPRLDPRWGYQSPNRLSVRMLEHASASAAGLTGVLFSVTPNKRTGRVDLGLDYSGFAQAYGGNFGSRLRLVAMPACALTTPELPSCRAATPLASVNDAKTQQLSVDLNLATASPSTGAMLLGATTNPGQEGGAAGTYAATSLKPSGSWTAGASTGSFTYNYPITVPSAASSLAPKVALSYDSGSLDGQTATTWAQSSWVGDGWSTPRSYIEQSFVSCADKPEGTASPTSSGDMCYDGPVLTLSLNGSSTSLVWDATKQVWKAQKETGQVITHVTNSGNGTGTYNTDYWKVTERDGTVYSFGINHLPGWTSGKAATNSVDSEPVYSAHSGDPCYDSSGFSSSVCTMAYRWNLDYVKDVHGDAMAYYYTQATNKYAQNNGASTGSYVRESHLAHIDYGFTDGNAYGTVPDKVVFGTADRCVSGTCDPLNSTTKANWPDVPFDLICSASPCTSGGPSFFSTVRLASITTKQYSIASSGYVDVDSYALTQTLPDPTDHTSPTLWLSSITRTGHDTSAGGSGAITLPPVTFTSTPLQNRVDTTNLPPLYRFRIGSITTETGSVITPTYTLVDPCSTPVTVTPSSNTSSCYPVYWTPDGYTDPYLDWFNKYVVTKVTTTDPTGGAPAAVTSYRFLGGAAWHYDDNEVVQAKYRTYGQFRGYAKVQTLAGDGDTDDQTLVESIFYRGMSKDHNSTTVNLTDSQGGTHEDVNQLSGSVLESTTYRGDGGPVENSTINSYWVSPATATRSRSGLSALTANWVGQVESYTRTAVTSTGSTTWRYAETDTGYDTTASSATYGLVTHTYTHTVPADTDYDKCTSTTYAPANTSANLIGLAAQIEVDAVACGGFTEGTNHSVPAALNTLTDPSSVNRPAQVVADHLAFYDDSSFATTFPQTAAPTKGEVTMVRVATDYTGGAFHYQTTQRTTYDSYGRPTTVYDAKGNQATTSYTTNSVGLTTQVTQTNPLGQSTITDLATPRGIAIGTTDINSVQTVEHYDAIGRLTDVWLANRSIGSLPNYRFTYQVSNTGVTAVTTKKLNDESGYQVSTLLYDGLLRKRQSQTPTPQGGRMVTDTFYDSRGWVKSTNNGWWDANTTPNTTLVTPGAVSGVTLPNQDFYVYDGLGRVVQDKSAQDGVVVSTTTTVYGGDRTTVIPPTGGVTTTTITDPLGRTIELDQYTSAPTVTTPTNTFTGVWSVSGGTTTATTYGYDSRGKQNTVTDADSNTWTTTFNLLGQAVSKDDPDAGTSTMAYDANGNLTQATDSRSKTVSYTYDVLNRKTGMYAAATSAQSSTNQLGSWVYDNSNSAVSGMHYANGHLTTATSYHGGAAYTTQQTDFNVFGESLGETITIPGAGNPLAGSYTFRHVYTSTTGLPFKDLYPAAGGLPTEMVVHGYASALDLPNDLGTFLSSYVSKVNYNAFGRVSQETIGAVTSNKAYLTNTYDPHTGRLTVQALTRANATPADVDRQEYTYDLAGNITRQVSTRLGSSTATETQCYTYDAIDRLTGAWTANDNCAVTPTAASHGMVSDSLGSASAYWSTWSFDALGNRTSQVQHAIGSGSDITTAYTYDGNGDGQPHTLTGTATSGGSTGSTSYQYNSVGGMTARNAAQGSQTLTWDDAGRLDSVTTPSAGTSYFVYGPDGGLLIQNDPDTTTLYLPGEQITLTKASQSLAGVRYYPLPGGGMAYRTGSGTNYGFQVTDLHGTPVVYLDHTAQTPIWRQYTPYGGPRGTASTWPDNHGFLNKVDNPTTGLSQIGARNYDPGTARFISLDPVLETGSPQQLNGYSYAANNPITGSDPTGLCMYSDGDLCISQGTDFGKAPSGDSGHDVTSGDHQKDCTYASASCYHPYHQVKVKVLKDGTTIEYYPYGQVFIDGHNLTTQLQWPGGPTPEEVAAGLDKWLGTHPFGKDRDYLIFSDDAFKWGLYEASVDGYYDTHESLFTLYVVFSEPNMQDSLATTGMMAAFPEDGIGFPRSKAGRRLGGCRNSFTPDTLVELADGTTKPIKDIKTGDFVLATDPQTGITEGRIVTALHIHLDTSLTDVTIKTDDGTAAVLHTTPSHLFWDSTTHTWTPAYSLLVGDQLATPDGHHPTVIAATTYIGHHQMRNLTIADFHTYYVLTDNVPVLVHNCGPNITDHGIEHSFDRHADQWFGRKVDKGDKMGEWRDLVTRAARSSIVAPWSSRGTPTYVHLAKVDGKWFAVQFDRNTGDLVTAFVPGTDQAMAMLRAAGK